MVIKTSEFGTLDKQSEKVASYLVSMCNDDATKYVVLHSGEGMPLVISQGVVEVYLTCDNVDELIETGINLEPAHLHVGESACLYQHEILGYMPAIDNIDDINKGGYERSHSVKLIITYGQYDGSSPMGNEWAAITNVIIE